MSAPATSSASFMRLLRRFRRNRAAAAALEFALVAPVFLALLFAILETALMFFADQVLETMTQQAARAILTGQAQNTSNYVLANFQQHVCDQIPAVFSCAKISVDVKSYSSFSTVTFSNQIDNNGNFISNNLQYNPGGPSCIVVVRVFYPWQLFVTRLGYNLSNMTNSQRLLIATAVFRNEPFPGNAAAPAPCS
jgi:Flp pilus assembly protein TadG